MQSMFVENGGSTQRVYESMLVGPEDLSIFSNILARKIIAELAQQPLCAMDLSRKLGQHEQKIYYHLRKMVRAGIVKLDRNEPRYGMTAKIYSLVSPVVATKLYDDAYTTNPPIIISNQTFLDFMHPFINDGVLNAKIIIGDTYAHGRFDTSSTEGPHAFDFAVLLGNHLKELKFPFYELDTEVSKDNLKGHIILFGNPRTNTIIDKINDNGHKYFDNESGILSGVEKKLYEDPRTGIIIKDTNPFNKNKKMLIIGGVRTRGMQAAIIALTREINLLMTNHEKNDSFVHIVQGLDKDGDKRIDSVNIIE